MTSKPYPVPYAVCEAMKPEVQDMINLSVIKHCSSPYSSPVVRIPKKDGMVRFCIDYRKLNAITVYEPEPMPDPQVLFSELTKSNFFSKIDLSKGYWQIPLAQEAKNKTAFVTPDGQFRFCYLPFGLVNAPGKFTLLIRALFKDEPCVVNFIDDISCSYCDVARRSSSPDTSL